MAAMFHQPCLIFFFLIVVVLPYKSFSQSNSPQNIETFFPFAELSPVPPPLLPPPVNPSPSSSSNSSSSSDRGTIIKAVLITAASSIVIAAAFFFFLQKCVIARRRRRRDNRVGVENTLQLHRISAPLPFPPPVLGSETLAREGFTRFGGVKGLILDENGQDVLYWKKMQSQRERRSEGLRREIIANGEEEKEVIYYKNKKKSEPVNEIPLLRGRSSTSQSVIHNEIAIAPPPVPVK